MGYTIGFLTATSLIISCTGTESSQRGESYPIYLKEVRVLEIKPTSIKPSVEYVGLLNPSLATRKHFSSIFSGCCSISY